MNTTYSDLLQVGAITSTHGVRGQVKVFPTTDDARRYDHLKHVILDDGAKQMDLEIEKVQYFKQFVIVKFRGYDSINEIEKFKGAKLFVTREDAVPLEEDEFFIADLIGMSVLCEDGRVLGRVSDVLETGANDVYVVQDEKKRELLLPAIKECIKNVDLESSTITIHWMDGLFWKGEDV